jgi:hypothetical protein
MLAAGRTDPVADDRRHWLEQLLAAATLQAETLRADDTYHHEALLEDLDDLCRRIRDELAPRPRSGPA